MTFYVLLMRHGAVDRKSSDNEANQRLSDKGIEQSYEVAKGLFDYLETLPKNERVEIGKVFYAPYRHANETAGAVVAVFRKGGMELSHVECQELSPDRFWAPQSIPAMAASASGLRAELGDAGNAVLIVGHDPQLGWIGNELIGRRRRFHYPLPLPPPTRSETHCLGFEDPKKPGRHLWSISPSDPETRAGLQEKIKSKISTAGQLSAFMSLLLGISLGIVAEPAKLEALIPKKPPLHIGSWIPGAEGLLAAVSNGTAKGLLATSVVSLFLATGLYLAAMFAYDTLLMPKRFWEAQRWNLPGKLPGWIPRRPPSPDVWVLYANMMSIWRWMFVPATLMVVVGLLSLAELVFRIHPVDFGLLVIVVGGAFERYRRWRSPQLGAED
jgi:phosphohistidine phosphatase SixA